MKFLWVLRTERLSYSFHTRRNKFQSIKKQNWVHLRVRDRAQLLGRSFILWLYHWWLKQFISCKGKFWQSCCIKNGISSCSKLGFLNPMYEVWYFPEHLPHNNLEIVTYSTFILKNKTREVTKKMVMSLGIWIKLIGSTICTEARPF